MDLLTILADLAGSNLQIVTLGLVFAGILLVTIGAAVAFGRDEVERRYGAPAADRIGSASSVSVRRQAANRSPSASGVSSFVAPSKEKELLAARRRLIHAGYRSPNAVFLYFLVRAGFGLLLPGLLMIPTLGFALTAGSFDVELPLIGFSANSTLLLLALLVLIGYHGPALFIGHRIRLRQQAIREAFPNALDLMQVAVQAGLGFDAALTRIAEEMRGAHPLLAEDLGMMVLELRAGKPRDRVLNDLGERTGVVEITAFATVMNQSMSYGTSISDALETYAKEMRSKRMMRAEELANKLPVKMSIVMVLCLLPILFLILLGPVVIRMIRTVGPLISNFD